MGSDHPVGNPLSANIHTWMSAFVLGGGGVLCNVLKTKDSTPNTR